MTANLTPNKESTMSEGTIAGPVTKTNKIDEIKNSLDLLLGEMESIFEGASVIAVRLHGNNGLEPAPGGDAASPNGELEEIHQKIWRIESVRRDILEVLSFISANIGS